MLLARFAVLAQAFRPGQGKDPGEDCLYTPCIPATIAERAGYLPWVRQFFDADGRTGALVRTAPTERLTEMQWLLPAGLVLFLLGFAGLLFLALRERSRESTFGFVVGARIGRLQRNGSAVGLGCLWALAPSIGVFIAAGRWESALGYGGFLLLGSLGLLLLVESRPPGFGTFWAVRVFGANLAAAAAVAALMIYPVTPWVPVFGLLFAYPPFLATVPVFVVCALIAGSCRARLTKRLLAEPAGG